MCCLLDALCAAHPACPTFLGLLLQPGCLIRGLCWEPGLGFGRGSILIGSTAYAPNVSSDILGLLLQLGCLIQGLCLAQGMGCGLVSIRIAFMGR